MNKRQQKKANKPEWIPLIVRVKLRNGKIRNRKWKPFGYTRYAKIIRKAVNVSDINLGACSPCRPFHTISIDEMPMSQMNEILCEMRKFWLKESIKAGGHWINYPGYQRSDERITPYLEPERGIGPTPIWSAP